ncbi:ATP-binding protein [Herbaspirillum sp. NPDC087042]|uniref:ATP-binding protein n=1 Tax=Herbaspirillum sp. NPDC087042 TaxID=3364004 RepID=UPI003830295A
MFFSREHSLGLIEFQDGLQVRASSSYERLHRAGIVPGLFLAIVAPEWISDGAQEFILVRFLKVTAQRDSKACELHCRIMGSCRIDQRTGQLSYYAGLPAYAALMLLPSCACHALPEGIMRSLLALSGDAGETFELGHVRWGEHHGKDAHTVPVTMSVNEVVGKRTAMFGKTRLGKSNVVKLLMQGVLNATRRSGHVGQLVFDVNGEYANDNPQDGNFSIASAYPERVLVYFLSTQPRGDGEFLRYNFFDIPERALTIFSELLTPSVLEIPEVRNFLMIRFPALSALKTGRSDDSAVAFRKLCLYWTLLQEAGFEPGETVCAEIAARGLTNAGITLALRMAAWQTIKSKVPPPMPTSFTEMAEEIRVLSAFALKYANDPNLRVGRTELFDEEDRVVQELLCQVNGVGPYFLRECLQFHSANASDFLHDTLRAIDTGKTVIIDLGAANERIVRYFSRIISTAVFQQQEHKFITNTLAGRFVQIYFEEAHMIFPVDAAGKNTTDIYARFAKEGAKFGIGIVYSTQSPTSVSYSLLTQTENFFIGHLSSDIDVDALASVQSLFGAVKDDILQFRLPGFMRVLSYSRRFVLPIQAKRFDPRERR